MCEKPTVILLVVVVAVVLRKIRTHLDLLSIPQSGGKMSSH